MDEAEMRALAVPAFEPDGGAWRHLTREPGFDYPIDYWYQVIEAQHGAVCFVMTWAPNAYCHFHRHVGNTKTLVVAGEHHIVETSATETIHKTRKAGHFARSPAGDVHMEYGGSAGSTVLFHVEAADGRLFEILDKDRNVLTVATIESFCAPEPPAR